MNRHASLRFWTLLVFTAAIASFAGCDDDSTQPDPAAATGTLEIRLVETAGGEALVEYSPSTPSTIAYSNEAGNVFGVSLFEYLLTKFELSGSAVPKATGSLGDHYRNAFSDATRTIVLDDVPVGSYDTLNFYWGVDPDRNFTNDPVDGDGLGAEALGLKWPDPLGGGYHCMRLEGPYNVSAVGDGSFQLHMGRLIKDAATTNCHTAISLDGLVLNIVEGETISINLLVDVSNFMNDPILDFTQSAGGLPLDGPTMPNHAAQALMRDNVGDVFDVIQALP